MRNSKNGRFVIWDLTSDPFDHTQLTTNFDRLDSMIGGPNGSAGLSGTRPTGTASNWLSLGDSANDPYNRSLYSIITGLNYNDVPLGTVVYWWRPNPVIDLPNGWVVCDGSKYTNNTTVTPPVVLHSYPFTTITVPDLRNKFVLGAYETNADSHLTAVPSPALRRDGLPSTPNDNQLAGPGIGYSSTTDDFAGAVAARSTAKFLGVGSNVPRNLLHVHDPGSYRMMDHYHEFTHFHSMAGHTHDNWHIHEVGEHLHWMPHTHSLSGHSHNMDHQHYTRHRHPVSIHSDVPDSYDGTLHSGTGPTVIAGTGHRHYIIGLSEHATWEDGYVEQTHVGDPRSPSDPWNQQKHFTDAPTVDATGGPSRDQTFGLIGGPYYTGSPLHGTDIPGNITGGPSPGATYGPFGSSSPKGQTWTGKNDLNGLDPAGISGTPIQPAGVSGLLDLNSIDTRPAFIGLLAIIKIKVADNLI